MNRRKERGVHGGWKDEWIDRGRREEGGGRREEGGGRRKEGGGRRDGRTEGRREERGAIVLYLVKVSLV